MAESGHAKNVENWQKMIAACTGFGGDYKPSNVNLTVGSMTALLTDVETEMDGVQTSIVPWKNKVADRENIYTVVRPRTTHLLAAFKASGAAANRVDLRTFSDKAPRFSPKTSLIKGVISGNCVQILTSQFTHRARVNPH